MSLYHESAREITVVADYDVIVAGGGPAGIGAALGAARSGARTLIVEEYNVFGGMLTTGMMSHWIDSTESPLMTELQQRCRELAPPAEDRSRTARQAINHETMKLAIFDLLEAAGVTMRLHTRAVEVMRQDRRVTGVILESKSGRQAIAAKVTVDATGDGDLAACAGAAYTLGRENDGAMQPATLMFKIGGVDPDRAITPGSFETKVGTPDGEIQALARRELPPPAGHVLLYASVIPGETVVNMTNLTGIDGTDADSLTRAEIAAHRQIPVIINFLRRYAPGYENAFLLGAASCIGIRETRHFKGLYELTAEDIIEARVFSDWIACRNFFNFDIHNVNGSGLDANGEQHHFRARGSYTISYRCCVPAEIDGLLLAGRNISGSHKAHSNFRVMPICANIGYGVGVAAALAAENNRLPREVEVAAVQQQLIRLGVKAPEA